MDKSKIVKENYMAGRRLGVAMFDDGSAPSYGRVITKKLKTVICLRQAVVAMPLAAATSTTASAM